MEPAAVPAELISRIRPLKGLILDVDGVLTDGRVIIDDAGRESKHFDVRDGHGLKLLQRTGIRVALLTGRVSRVVEHRARELGIDLVFQRIRDKLAAYERIRELTGFRDGEICYIGDDLVDVPVLARAGFAVTVADGSAHLAPYVHWRSAYPGGHGAVRELCELIMAAQGTWTDVTSRYLPRPRP
ncbi:MAG: HAD-IIIA family hydrolase [Deltaproteobacteria bacterium]|nr:HAD-IIIA family hydrolase [Candidatus Anaeroferrophillacea bacterium]